jgi:hypothetical protein
LNVALSFGVSFAGYQLVAECGSPAANAPPDDDSCQPFSPSEPSWVISGTPEYFTRVSNVEPFDTEEPAVITSSWSPDRVNSASAPFTWTDETSRPCRSRLNFVRSSVAVAVTTVSPVSSRDDGS